MSKTQDPRPKTQDPRPKTQALDKQLLRAISHDLKSPLASVEEAVQLLLRETVGPLNDSQRQIVDLCGRNAGRVRGMVADLADFLRLECGWIDFELSSQPVLNSIRAAAESVRKEAEAGEVEIRQELEPRDLEAVFDRVQLTEAIAVLLSNAVGHAPKGSEVELSAFQVSGGNSVRISVRDRGPGVPHQLRHEIFEPFYVLRTRESGSSGLSLGLARCNLIVKAHGGRVWCEAAEPKGAVFIIEIPK